MTGALLFAASAEMGERDGFFELRLTSGEVTTTYVMSPSTATVLVASGQTEIKVFQSRQSLTPFKGKGGKPT